MDSSNHASSSIPLKRPLQHLHDASAKRSKVDDASSDDEMQIDLPTSLPARPDWIPRLLDDGEGKVVSGKGKRKEFTEDVPLNDLIHVSSVTFRQLAGWEYRFIRDENGNASLEPFAISDTAIVLGNLDPQGCRDAMQYLQGQQRHLWYQLRECGPMLAVKFLLPKASTGTAALLVDYWHKDSAAIALCRKMGPTIKLKDEDTMIPCRITPSTCSQRATWRTITKAEYAEVQSQYAEFNHHHNRPISDALQLERLWRQDNPGKSFPECHWADRAPPLPARSFDNLPEKRFPPRASLIANVMHPNDGIYRSHVQAIKAFMEEKDAVAVSSPVVGKIQGALDVYRDDRAYQQSVKARVVDVEHNIAFANGKLFCGQWFNYRTWTLQQQAPGSVASFRSRIATEDSEDARETRHPTGRFDSVVSAAAGTLSDWSATQDVLVNARQRWALAASKEDLEGFERQISRLPAETLALLSLDEQPLAISGAYRDQAADRGRMRRRDESAWYGNQIDKTVKRPSFRADFRYDPETDIDKDVELRELDLDANPEDRIADLRVDIGCDPPLFHAERKREIGDERHAAQLPLPGDSDPEDFPVDANGDIEIIEDF